ncbi:DUF1349 domain-containing protein [Streptomyces thermolineatus]|uniref:DUF1349 domain-containing protein n=1 Tax=Streptomyces thermolineatus TaxID=44033 RepID=UPI00384D6989
MSGPDRPAAPAHAHAPGPAPAPAPGPVREAAGPTAEPAGAPVRLTEGWRRDGAPAAFATTRHGIRVTAPAGADLFHSPGHRGTGVPALRRPLNGDFTAWAAVSVAGRRFADAGGLCLYGPDGWFKLCLERTRAGGWAAVSVLSRPDSDEALGPALPGPRAGLLLTREGGRVAAFVRAEEEPHGGRQPQEAGGWEFVRTFSGWTQHTLELGLFAQAPFSDGCTAAFESPHLGGRALRDRR